MKIHQGAEQYDEAEQALQAVYDRGGVRDITVLKAYTSFLFSTNQLDKGARLLGDYERVWLQQKRRSEQMSGRLTAAQQGERGLPYGHGIGIAYYHTVLDQDDQAERLLRGLIAFDPDQYGADNELATFYKNRGKLRTARNSIAQSYDRGGDKDTSTVVNYAGILQAIWRNHTSAKNP